jgi:hypothetical protein
MLWTLFQEGRLAFVYWNRQASYAGGRPATFSARWPKMSFVFIPEVFGGPCRPLAALNSKLSD